jgi:hypothetical protein
VSARSSHEWYRVQFPDYPLHRAALIPFIWWINRTHYDTFYLRKWVLHVLVYY